jgi:flagellar P-ring protein precursor FlgI
MVWSLVIVIMGFNGWAAVRGESPVSLRLKDIARIEGVRDNQLTGVGLVVGLNGTGDSNKAQANIQMVVNVLARNGINVRASDLKIKNVAAVVLTANLPAFLRSGDRVDVEVSSFGDAKSLLGGTLLQAPLTAADGRVYAVAQGPLVVSGYAAGNKGSGATKNTPTGAIIPNGALVEREVPVTMVNNGRLRLILNRPDFTTASRLARTINDNIGEGLARAKDMSLVEVTVPESSSGSLIDFIASLEGLSVTPDGVARIVISERTGTVVVGDGVRIAPVAVTHRNLTVQVKKKAAVSQPKPHSNGETKVTEQTKTAVHEEQGAMVALEAGATVGEIVRALNAVGTTPQDIIAVLIAMHKAGALYGNLEVI